MKTIAIKTIARKSSLGKTTFALVAMLALLVCSEVAVAQKSKSQSKVEAYLKKKDANGNGRIEPEEMSENTKKYLSKMGFDPNKKIHISKVVAKAEKAEDKREQDKRELEKRSVDLKVPAFGVAKESGGGVQSFGSGADSSSSSSKNKVAKTYSASVLLQTKQTLDRYDINKNGSIDASELKVMPWGSPKPSISDLNRDGRLSTNELSERYAAREKSKSKSSSSSSSKKSGGARSRSRYSSTSDSSRSSTTTTRSSSSNSSSSNSTSSKSSKPKEVDKDKYLKYTRSLIKTYDKDGDGKLNKSEVKKMRRPPVGAATDGDGFVSESELVDNLSGAKKAKKTASSSSASKSTSSGSKTSSTSSYRKSYSSSRTRTSSSLDKLDSNSDKQVQMHEFADQWDDETVAEFYQRDKNGDGVITAAEWLSGD